VGHGYTLGFHGVPAAIIHAGVVAWEGEGEGGGGVCVRKNDGLEIAYMKRTYCHSSKRPSAYA
jgi:hypothetical protein